jgi:hypothetical protein
MKDIFWTDLLKYFFELKSKEKIPLDVDSIIWYNSSLKIEGKHSFTKNCLIVISYVSK